NVSFQFLLHHNFYYPIKRIPYSACQLFVGIQRSVSPIWQLNPYTLSPRLDIDHVSMT
ncbi:MAG: hypothetical protein IIC26_07890, partial [Chloroflexi bacterium]|nr:hypothetical protein [Chloroflexota bacterium]